MHKKRTRLGACGLTALVLGSLAFGTALPANAAAPTANDGRFDRSSGMLYVSASPTRTAPTQLYQAPQSAAGLAFSPVGTTQPSYNALAFHEASEHLFAISNASTSRGALIRIDADGNSTNLGTVYSFGSTSLSTAATFGQGSTANRLFWTVTPSDRKTNTIRTVDLDADGKIAATGSFKLTSTVMATDMAFIDGYLWGVEQNGTMARMDPTNGLVTRFAKVLPAVTNPDTYAAAWTYGNGHLGVMDHSGKAFQLKITDTSSAAPTFSILSQSVGPRSLSTDAAYVPASQPIDLGIEKSAPASGNSGDTIDYKLKVTNHGPGGSSGAVVQDVLPAGLTKVTVPSNCTTSALVMTCNVGALAEGQSTEINFTAKLPADFASAVTNRATVIGNEADPNPTNDTDEATTIPSSMVVILPVARPDTNTTPKGKPVTTTVLGNDDGVDSEIVPGTVQIQDPATGTWKTTVSVPGVGNFSVNTTNGRITFTPSANFTGVTPPLPYKFSTADGDTAESTLTITVVAPANQLPVARADREVTQQGVPCTLQPLANDDGVDSPIAASTVKVQDPADRLWKTTVTVPGEGTYKVNPNSGEVTFTPAAGWFGETTPVNYELRTEDGDRTQSTITITVVEAPGTPVIDPAVAAAVGAGLLGFAGYLIRRRKA